jgi:hypothetical protein
LGWITIGWGVAWVTVAAFVSPTTVSGPTGRSTLGLEALVATSSDACGVDIVASAWDAFACVLEDTMETTRLAVAAMLSPSVTVLEPAAA